MESLCLPAKTLFTTSKATCLCQRVLVPGWSRASSHHHLPQPPHRCPPIYLQPSLLLLLPLLLCPPQTCRPAPLTLPHCTLPAPPLPPIRLLCLWNRTSQVLRRLLACNLSELIYLEVVVYVMFTSCYIYSIDSWYYQPFIHTKPIHLQLTGRSQCQQAPHQQPDVHTSGAAAPKIRLE